MEALLFAQLSQDVTINGLVNGRIYPKIAPQDVQSPYIVYHEITGTNAQCMGGNVYQSVQRFQVDIWSTKYSEVKSIREAVKSCILGFKSSFDIMTMDDYEAETKLFREMIDFKIRS